LNVDQNISTPEQRNFFQNGGEDTTTQFSL